MRWFQSGVGALATGPMCAQHLYGVRKGLTRGGWRALGPARLAVGITPHRWLGSLLTGSCVTHKSGWLRCTARQLLGGYAYWTAYRSGPTSHWS